MGFALLLSEILFAISSKLGSYGNRFFAVWSNLGDIEIDESIDWIFVQKYTIPVDFKNVLFAIVIIGIKLKVFS